MNHKIGVIGLGYVGLPLAIEFGKKYKTIGFDLNNDRVQELNRNFDKNNEVCLEDFNLSKNISFTNNPKNIAECNIYIVTVPTPVDDANIPDMSALISASSLISNFLKPNDIVVYESTVYPGATEEICLPVLEKSNSLKCLYGNKLKSNYFSLGYSPERVNPGDKANKITSINKIVSASNDNASSVLYKLYSSIITDATIYLAPNIKIAEAAKVIENTQRDVNIALINELAILFQKLKIDTSEVLKAASTKWNFLDFKPGLVGGHCIGVDPYYLKYTADRVIQLCLQKKINISSMKIALLGITFKENCPDLRNSKAYEIYKIFKNSNIHIDVYDPQADKNDARKEYGINLLRNITFSKYDVLIFAVNHKEYANINFKEMRSKMKKNCVVYDVKSFLPQQLVTERL